MNLSEPLDPRKVFVKKKYNEFPRIIAFASGKGGVGKSTLSGLFSMYLAQKGYRIGLMDLDFYGPSSHIILNAEIKNFPKEDKGVVPPLASNVYFMSVVFYSENKPLVMRGRDLSEAVIEILTITNWPKLDYIIFDMPPGLGDVLLTISELVSAHFIVVSGPSKVMMESVEKLIEFIKEQNIPYIGLIENMARKDSDFVSSRCEEIGFPYIGKVSFYENIEDLYGKPADIVSSPIGSEFNSILRSIENRL